MLAKYEAEMCVSDDATKKLKYNTIDSNLDGCWLQALWYLHL